MAVVLYKSINKTVNTIAQRNAIPIKHDHMIVTVLDAIADPNAGAGIATYRYNATLSEWILISKATFDTINFQTEETLISGGQVSAVNTPKDGQIWGVYVIDGDTIIADLRDEDLTIVANVISGLSSYDGYKLRFTYAYGSIGEQITAYTDARIAALPGNAPETLDSIEELATAIETLQTSSPPSPGTISDFEAGLLMDLWNEWYEQDAYIAFSADSGGINIYQTTNAYKGTSASQALPNATLSFRFLSEIGGIGSFPLRSYLSNLTNPSMADTDFTISYNLFLTVPLDTAIGYTIMNYDIFNSDQTQTLLVISKRISNLLVNVQGSQGWQSFSNSIYPIGSWFNVKIQYEKSIQQFRMYINDVLRSTINRGMYTTPQNVGVSRLQIGQPYIGGSKEWFFDQFQIVPRLI